MLVDTHCHIYLEQFDEDRDEVLDRAADRGVTDIYMPAINMNSLSQMNALNHPRIHLHKMAGIHPTEINRGVTAGKEELYDICREKDIVAVGETGLDYHWSADFKADQKENLHLHCRVAKSLDRPVVLHNRESTRDLLAVIEEEQDGDLRGVWHCFNGTVREGRKAVDLGLVLGIGGVLTFKNAGVDETVAQLPLEQMILETDAPYLAPHPHRGRRNEPSFIHLTAEKLAEVMELPVQRVEEITRRNAFRLFGVDA